MLRHIVDAHEGDNIKEIQRGMFIREFKRSAFEGQIDEAVSITREAKKHELLD